jgi:hypothetical protein
MRRIALAVTAALTAMVVGGAPGAGAEGSGFVSTTSLLAANVQAISGNQGADVYGVGGGKANFGLQKFNLSAHEGPDGDFGHVGVSYYDPMGNLIVSYSVNLICVNIHTLPGSSTYDRGVLKGVITKITPVPNLLTLEVGDVVDFGIKDGGNSSSTLPVDDFYAPGSPGVPPDASCKLFTYLPTQDLNNVTQGNVSIKGP